jgi:nicotinamidase/pyrazinamidase
LDVGVMEKVEVQEEARRVRLLPSDALIIVDVQNDFCPGGALPVPKGDEVVDPINSIIPLFSFVVATQDWHPNNHISFRDRGGPWPPHCVAGTWGAELHPRLRAEGISEFVKKGDDPDKEAYSGFDGTGLADILRSKGVERVFVCGLATDYCVKATALDAIRNGFKTYVVVDAVRAVDVNPGDGERALEEMRMAGAILLNSEEISI